MSPDTRSLLPPPICLAKITAFTVFMRRWGEFQNIAPCYFICFHMSHIYVYPCRIADAFTSMFMTHTCQSWYTIVLFRHVKVHQRMHKLSRKKTKWAKIGPNHFLKTGGPIKDSKRGPHADLKFIATAATDGRLKFCQVCKFFQFLTYLQFYTHLNVDLLHNC